MLAIERKITPMQYNTIHPALSSLMEKMDGGNQTSGLYGLELFPAITVFLLYQQYNYDV